MQTLKLELNLFVENSFYYLRLILHSSYYTL